LIVTCFIYNISKHIFSYLLIVFTDIICYKDDWICTKRWYIINRLPHNGNLIIVDFYFDEETSDLRKQHFWWERCVIAFFKLVIYKLSKNFFLTLIFTHKKKYFFYVWKGKNFQTIKFFLGLNRWIFPDH